MNEDWKIGWKSIGRTITGGQGKSSEVQAILNHEKKGFLKQLKRPRNLQDRARFRREVTSYETLPDAGLPKLYEHNADSWRDTEISLYLVLEYIDGPHLEKYIQERGPLPLSELLEFVEPLLNTLEACHAQDVLHRDIKPRNIVVRDSQFGGPVLVDFGLSFNLTSDTSDVTRIDEEIGNRFLRLPEQSSRLRSPLTDVSQLCGVIFFALTGLQPRVLLDETGAMPHQRSEARRRLEEIAQGSQLGRLLQFFDKGFAPTTEFRYQDIGELRLALERITVSDTEDGDYESLIRRVTEVANSPLNQARGQTSAKIEYAIKRATGLVQDFASARNLVMTQSAQSVHVDQDVPAGQTLLSVQEPGRPHNLVTYVFELRGTEIVLVICGEVRWRGTDLEEQDFEQAVIRVAASRYLDSHDN